MRFVEPKSEQQQASAVLFRGRERLIHQRTELVNALRAVMYEYGYTVPQGFCHIKRIQAILDETNIDLPALVVEECRDLIEQIDEKSRRINLKTAKVKELATKTDKARRLQTMLGVGPITALAVEAFAPEMEAFKRGRDFAAWLGLVPRQYSTGGKERLGRIPRPDNLIFVVS
jgi:transposase